ncbi:MAG: HupE/UreJ family protein [Alphaproteobacteria bacterium]|nr:HupE/UreJ family protein [Alphaproteobacteria bacterium]
MNQLGFLLAVIAILFTAAPAQAHQTSLSYISVADEGGALAANFKVSFLDLEVAIGIDQDLDGKVTWGETRESLDAVSSYALSRTVFTAGGVCSLALRSAEPLIDNGEAYLSLGFALTCPDPEAPVAVSTSMFSEIDPTSRVLVSSVTGGERRSFVLRTGDPRASSGVSAAPGARPENALISYFREGVSHLFGGPDHMLFLLVLIIPAIYAGATLRHVAVAVLLPITGFTLGHALTLTAAASGLVRPPAQIVETLIAVTILLTAVDNVRRFIPGPRSVVAFLFGLIHGFGFAGALGALDLDSLQMAMALLGFNLGIEAGQAVLALAAAPLLFLVRAPALHLRLMPLGVSIVAGAMAVFWIVERSVSLN